MNLIKWTLVLVLGLWLVFIVNPEVLICTYIHTYVRMYICMHVLIALTACSHGVPSHAPEPVVLAVSATVLVSGE